MSSRRFLLPLLASVVLGAVPSAAHAACPDESMVVRASQAPRVRDALLCLVNEARTARGYPAVASQSQLELAGQWQTDDMLARGYFAHEAPAPAPHGAQPRDRANAAGWPAVYPMNEILMAGATTPFQIVDFFITGDFGHCGILMAPAWRSLGIGISTINDQPDPANDQYIVGLEFGTTPDLDPMSPWPMPNCPDSAGMGRPSVPETSSVPPAAAAAPGSGAQSSSAPTPANSVSASDPGLTIHSIKPLAAHAGRGRGLKITLSCAGSCAGTVSLKRAAATKATAAFSVAAGQRTTVKARLPRSVDQAMRRNHQRKLSFVVTTGSATSTGSAILR